MSFRVRLTLVAATAVALAVALASAVVYVVVRGELRAQLDDSLRDRATQVARAPLGRTHDGFIDVPGPRLGSPGGYIQAVLADGTTLRLREANVPVPVSQRVLDVAAGRSGSFFADENVGGTGVRVLTFPYEREPGVALQVLRPLSEIDSTLARIRGFLLLIALLGVGLAVALGLIVSRAAIAPVTRLTRATERVTETGDLSERIDTTRRGRAEPPRRQLQRHARGTRGVHERAAPARRRRLPRVAHPADQPANELRGADERQGARS